MSNQKSFDPNNNIQNRVFRVFVSSTFIDMQDERQYLMETIFPRIKKYCQERDVYFIPIDLRWGITKEQSESGQVVEVCLKSIKQSKPYFIGLLGERYGWKPEKEELKKNPNMKRDFDFLEEDFEKRLSLTEIEMQYGVLREPELMNAAFWIRSKDSVPQAPSYNTPLDDQKLEALKAEVRSQSRYPVGEYASIEDMGNQVELFFKKVVDRIFPDKTSRLEKLMAQQHSFIQQKRRLYVPRQDDYERINAFVDGTSQFLTITGERGNGKSALVSNWMETRSDLKFLYCFVGASEQSDNPVEILKLLIAQLNPDLIDEFTEKSDNSFNIDAVEEPKSSDEHYKNEIETLHNKFRDAISSFHSSNPDERIVLIIDGVNQIFEDDSSKGLFWIPSLPEFVKAVFTTWKDDVTMKSLERFKADSMDVAPLTVEQRKKIITFFLKERNRELTPEQINRITADKETSSPVVLRTLLDELCFFGIYEKLDQQIDLYLSADSQEEFFDRVLGRLEKSFGQSVVTKLLTVLSASRFGLSNEELLGVASYKEKSLRSKIRNWLSSLMKKNIPSVNCTLFNWEQIYYSLDSHFVVRSGLNCFSHDIIASAAQKRYQSGLKRVRRQIVEYLEINGSLERKCEEIPWLLYQINDWSKLNQFLLNYDVLFYMSNSYDFKRCWLALYEKGYSLEAYFDLDISELSSNDQVRYYYELAAFGESIGKFLISEQGYRKALDVLRHNAEDSEDPIQRDYNLALTHNRLGRLYFRLNRLAQAENAYAVALEIFQRLYRDEPDKYGSGYVITMINHGLLCLQKGLFDQSEKEFSEALAINRSLINADQDEIKQFNATIYHNQGNLYYQMNRCSEAEQAYQESLNILNELNLKKYGQFDGNIALTNNSMALLHIRLGNYSLAERYITESLTIYRRLVDENPDAYKIDLTRPLLNHGIVLFQTNRYSEAETAFLEALDLFNELNWKNYGAFDGETAKTLGNMGYLYLEQDRLSDANYYISEAFKKYSRLVDESPNVYKYDFARTLLNQGLLLARTEYFLDAKVKFLQALNIYKELNRDNSGIYDGDIARTQTNLGALYSLLGCYSDSERHLSESLELYRKLVVKKPDVYKGDLAEQLSRHGDLYMITGHFSKAEAKFLEAYNIYKELGSEKSDAYDGEIAIVLNKLGGLYIKMCRFSEAEDNLTAAFNIFVRITEQSDVYKSSLAMTFFNFGDLYMETNRFNESETCFNQAGALFYYLNPANSGLYDSEITKTRKRLGLLFNRIKNLSETE